MTKPKPESILKLNHFTVARIQHHLLGIGFEPVAPPQLTIKGVVVVRLAPSAIEIPVTETERGTNVYWLKMINIEGNIFIKVWRLILQKWGITHFETPILLVNKI